MKNILKKSISCCLLFCAVLLCCNACGTETEPPDTIEDILNPRKKQETETESETGFHLFTSVPTEAETAAGISEMVTEIPETLPPETVIPETVLITEFPEFSENTEIPESIAVPEAETAPETAPVITEAITEPPTEAPSPEWEKIYRVFLENGTFQRQISAEVQAADTRFLLLYLNDDDIPELFIQTTMEVLIYTCHNGQAVFVDSFYPSHYTYDFYYRPYRSCLGSLQGSVMSDGTYLEIYEYEENPAAASGFALKETYCYPTRESNYATYLERGMNIDLEHAPVLDIHPDRQNNIGSSWITVPDVLEASTSVPRYEIRKESLDSVFGSDELPAAAEPEEGRYAFR